MTHQIASLNCQQALPRCAYSFLIGGAQHPSLANDQPMVQREKFESNHAVRRQPRRFKISNGVVTWPARLLGAGDHGQHAVFCGLIERVVGQYECRAAFAGVEIGKREGHHYHVEWLKIQRSHHKSLKARSSALLDHSVNVPSSAWVKARSSGVARRSLTSFPSISNPTMSPALSCNTLRTLVGTVV